VLLVSVAFAGPVLNDPDRPYAVELTAELGLLAPMSHRIQLGTGGDDLNYVREAGQDILFPFARPTAALRWRRQTFTLVYQPLDLNTTESLDRDLQVNGTVFPAGRPIDFRYGFSFWRLSWADRVVNRDDLEIGLGLGLQIRNATIGFTSVDGSQSEFNRDIGPVPLLEFEVRKAFESGLHLEAEVDGFYAPIKYLNGRDVDVEGAIADIQLRAGLDVAEPTMVFLGLRYLGGGASGTGTPDGSGDGYTENWLHFATLTLGARVR
jgi:hypothetical protein